MWRVLVLLLVFSQSAFAQPAVESLKAEFEKALNEVKSLQADIRNKQAKLEASLRKVEKLMGAVSVSEDKNKVTVSVDGNEILEVSRAKSTHPAFKERGTYERGLKILAPNDDSQEIGKTSIYGNLTIEGDSGHASYGAGPSLSFFPPFPDFNNGRTFYMAFGDTHNNPSISKDDFIFFSWGEGGKNRVRHMTLKADGNVGIGTTNPKYKLDVEGKVHAKEFVQSSDERLKQNIQPLASSLSKLAQLRGVSFKWKDEPQDNQIGLVAQEVEKVLPEIVSTDSEGYKSIAYGKLTAVLLEAIKELQQQVEELKGRD